MLSIHCRGERINKSWVELHTSRGIESYHHKMFMRYSGEATPLTVPAVIVLRIAIFIIEVNS